MKSMIAIAAALLLTACGGSRDTENSGVTAEESVALNNAAQMLDTPEDVVMAPDEGAMGNGLPVAEDVNDVAPAAENAPANAQ